MFEIKISNKIS